MKGLGNARWRPNLDRMRDWGLWRARFGDERGGAESSLGSLSNLSLGGFWDLGRKIKRKRKRKIISPTDTEGITGVAWAVSRGTAI